MSRLAGPSRISDWVDWWADASPDSEALVLDPIRWTYADLAPQVSRLAQAMLANGVARGDRVAVMGEPRPECFTVMLAASRIGAITMGLNPKFPLRELRYFVDDAEPRLLVAVGDADDPLHGIAAEIGELSPSIERVVSVDAKRPEAAGGWSDFLAEGDGVAAEQVVKAFDAVEPGDPVLIVYTSGSTGQPKGAVLPNEGLVVCSEVQADHWATSEVRLLVNLPVNHIGFMGDMCSFVLVAGGTSFFMEQFDPVGILDLIARERLTAWGQVPTMFQLTVAQPEFRTADLSSLELIVWGGASAPADLLEVLAESGARLATSFGMTETTGSVTYTRPDADLSELADTVGAPDPRFEVRLAGADGSPVQPGDEGEIQVRGRHVMLGYWQRPEATADAIDADGWFHTADIALLRDDGQYSIRGRLSEMYKSGGENVYPREVETVLEEHPGVAMAAVFGAPDEIYSEVGHAHVIRQPGHDPDPAELLAFCRTHLVNFKVPKQIVVHDMLPMLPIGKIDKVALRSEVLGAPAGA